MGLVISYRGTVRRAQILSTVLTPCLFPRTRDGSDHVLGISPIDKKLRHQIMGQDWIFQFNTTSSTRNQCQITPGNNWTKLCRRFWNNWLERVKARSIRYNSKSQSHWGHDMESKATSGDFVLFLYISYPVSEERNANLKRSICSQEFPGDLRAPRSEHNLNFSSTTLQCFIHFPRLFLVSFFSVAWGTDLWIYAIHILTNILRKVGNDVSQVMEWGPHNHTRVRCLTTFQAVDSTPTWGRIEFHWGRVIHVYHFGMQKFCLYVNHASNSTIEWM